MVRISDRFVLQREIGAGGMARVFLGRDEILGRLVAVKILKSEYGGTDLGTRFQREGRTAAKLSHPNIVQVYDAGEGEFEGEEASYIVMEYVPGGDLKALMDERGPLPGGRLSAIGAEVAAGLAHAHERGVIHRDIKPHNVLLEEGGRARLTDFGIARALDTTQATRTGSYLGTALYSPPEQLRGGEVTPKSDVYSLGVTLYQAATGEVPFTGTPIEVASQHVSREPAPPRGINPDVSGSMEALILACMSKNPDDRPTADETRVNLLEAGRGAHATRAYTEAPAEEPIPKRTPPPATPTRIARGNPRRKRPGMVLAMLGFLAVIAVIGALFLASPILSGSGDQQAGGGNARNAQAGSQPNGGPSGKGQVASDGQTASGSASESASGSASGSASESATSSASSGSQSAGSGSDTSGGATEEAGRTVEEFYTSAAQGDYDTSYDLLTEDWKQAQFPEQSILAGTFAPVEKITFVQGPTAEVSGDTATVTGTTRAELTTRTDRNEGTWRLVKENGKWLIDGWVVNLISSRPA
ncbi:MAG: protein kinase [Rubrobacter sp.]|nr:protein kinase [Rubrobacter sp.]